MSPGSAGDPIAAATALNDAVEATAVVGVLKEKVDGIDRRTTRIEDKVDHVISKVDNWSGRALVLGTIVSLAASVAISVFGQNLVHAVVAAFIR